MLNFYFGGVFATALIMATEAAAEGEQVDVACVIGALLWPLTVLLFVLDLLAERRR